MLCPGLVCVCCVAACYVQVWCGCAVWQHVMYRFGVCVLCAVWQHVMSRFGVCVLCAVWQHVMSRYGVCAVCCVLCRA
jgi:hypothetical protein